MVKPNRRFRGAAFVRIVHSRGGAEPLGEWACSALYREGEHGGG
jgi:hypothetical protein